MDIANERYKVEKQGLQRECATLRGRLEKNDEELDHQVTVPAHLPPTTQRRSL